MNEKIRDVNKMTEEVLRDRELWETTSDSSKFLDFHN